LLPLISAEGVGPPEAPEARCRSTPLHLSVRTSASSEASSSSVDRVRCLACRTKRRAQVVTRISFQYELNLEDSIRPPGFAVDSTMRVLSFHLAMGETFGRSGGTNNANRATAEKDRVNFSAAPSISRPKPHVISSQPDCLLLGNIFIEWRILCLYFSDKVANKYFPTGGVISNPAQHHG
jgi:hypothetical protein